MTSYEQRVKIKVMDRCSGSTLYTTTVPASKVQRFIDINETQATKVETTRR